MKIYVHHEGSGDEDFTWIWVQKDNQEDISVRNLVKSFVSVYNGKFSNAQLDIKTIKVSSDGENLSLDDDVPEVLEDRDDVFVVGKVMSRASMQTKSVSSSAPVSTPPSTAKELESATSLDDLNPETVSSINITQLKLVMESMVAKRYKQAMSVCNECIEAASEDTAVSRTLMSEMIQMPFALCLVHVYILTGRFRAAEDVIRRLVTPTFANYLGKTKGAAAVPPRTKGMLLTYQLLAVCATTDLLLHTKKYDACISYSQNNQKLVEASLKAIDTFYATEAHRQTEAYILLNFIFLPSAPMQHRLKLMGKGGNQSLVEMCKTLIPMNIASAQANCLYYQGRDQESVNIVNSLMVPAEQAMHVPLLLSYCQIALKYSKVDECVASVLRCITVDPDNQNLHRVLLGCLTADIPQMQLVSQSQGGSAGATVKQYFPTLSKYLPMKPSAVGLSGKYVVPSFLSAIGFLANICKQYSKVYLAVDLYRHKIFDFYRLSTTDGPAPMNFILNYIHVLEISHNYSFILAECIRCMGLYHAASGKYGVFTSLKGLLGSFLSLLRGQGTYSSKDTGGSADLHKCYGINWSTDADAGSGAVASSAAFTESVAEVFELKPVTTGADAVVFTAGNIILDGADTGSHFAPGGAATATVLAESGSRTYSEEDLDVLAICFTAIKIIFLYCGNNGGCTPVQATGVGSTVDTPESVPDSNHLVQILPLLYSHMERARVQSSVPLHSSSIRNEHAYYLAIGHLLSVATRTAMGLGLVDGDTERSCLYSPCSVFNHHQLKLRPRQDGSSSSAAVGRQIYVCGDSHCLSLSHYTSGSIRFIPKLVTGIKHYHLWGESIDSRYTHGKDMSTLSELLHVVKGHDANHGPDAGAPGTATGNSKFYTKANFYHFMEEIPSNSEVMFLIGEIDCREGLLKAVEQGKHDSLDEAIRTNIREFLRVLKGIMQKKHIKPYIHPALPVLDETRGVVLEYNRVYKEMVAEIPGVKFLDFVPELLEPMSVSVPSVEELDDKGEVVGAASEALIDPSFVLKAPYVLDGTHIHPRYIDVLMGCL